MVELEPEVEEQPLLEDAGGDLRVADRAQEDRIFRAQEIEAALGDDLTRLEVAVAAPVERLDVVGEALVPRHGGEHLHRFGGDFGPGAVSGNCGDLQCLRGHGVDGARQMAELCGGKRGGHEVSFG